MRSSEISRKTSETEIELWLELDGRGNASIDTGVGFMDHMLTLLAKHSRFDLMVQCKGDTHVDDHHSVEDIGIALGKAFADALGDKKGINRYADTTLAMDEALVLTSIDISGRSYLGYDLAIPTEKVGTFDTELVEEFLMAFVRTAGVTLHVMGLRGKNSHHIIEGMFKSLARTLRRAAAIDADFADDIPSTKGVLDDAGSPGGLIDEEIPGEDGDEPVEYEEYEEYEEAREADDYEAADYDGEEDDDDYYIALQEQADEDAFDGEPYDDTDDSYESIESYAGEYDEYHDGDPSVDDVDLLAERIARESLYSRRVSTGLSENTVIHDSTGLGDDMYGRGVAKGYTDMDIPVRDVDEE